MLYSKTFIYTYVINNIHTNIKLCKIFQFSPIKYFISRQVTFIILKM